MGAVAIGTLLVVIAVFLAFELSSMLVGESALPEEEARIGDALAGEAGVESVIHMRTLHTGPDELLVGVKIGVKPEYRAGQLASVINAAERRIREAVPAARWIYIEPDIAREPAGGAPRPPRTS